MLGLGSFYTCLALIVQKNLPKYSPMSGIEYLLIIKPQTVTKQKNYTSSVMSSSLEEPQGFTGDTHSGYKSITFQDKAACHKFGLGS